MKTKWTRGDTRACGGYWLNGDYVAWTIRFYELQETYTRENEINGSWVSTVRGKSIDELRPPKGKA